MLVIGIDAGQGGQQIALGHGFSRFTRGFFYQPPRRGLSSLVKALDIVRLAIRVLFLISLTARLVWAGNEVNAHPRSMHEQSAHAQSTAKQTDEAQIIARLKADFEHPQQPLLVHPVVVRGSYALAGWAQGERGGRAFLEKTLAGWRVRMCAGEHLTRADSLQGLGLNKTQAQGLIQSLMQVEATMSAAEVARLSSFESVLLIEPGQVHGAHGHSENKDGENKDSENKGAEDWHTKAKTVELK